MLKPDLPPIDAHSLTDAESVDARTLRKLSRRARFRSWVLLAMAGSLAPAGALTIPSLITPDDPEGQIVVEQTMPSMLPLRAIMAEDEPLAEMPGRLVDQGSASFYGNEFAGSRTANGERFNPNELTAAHPSLPMGSTVRVTNVRNGRSVILRINDRGPFAKNRVIDVSKRAAQELGFVSRGTAPVTVEVLPRARS